MSPPERERRPGGNRTADPLAADTRHLTVSDAVRLWRNGRAELPCGHRGDPHADCRQCEPLTPQQTEAAVEALTHLDAVGAPGLADVRTCRALHRAGFRDLAAAVHRRTVGV